MGCPHLCPAPPQGHIIIHALLPCRDTFPFMPYSSAGKHPCLWPVFLQGHILIHVLLLHRAMSPSMPLPVCRDTSPPMPCFPAGIHPSPCPVSLQGHVPPPCPLQAMPSSPTPLSRAATVGWQAHPCSTRPHPASLLHPSHPAASYIFF